MFVGGKKIDHRQQQGLGGIGGSQQILEILCKLVITGTRQISKIFQVYYECSISGVFQTFRIPFNSKIHCMDPIRTDLFHENY